MNHSETIAATLKLRATQVAATIELLDAGNNWAPMALSDGKLLIRDQKKLIVVQVGQPGR